MTASNSGVGFDCGWNCRCQCLQSGAWRWCQLIADLLNRQRSAGAGGLYTHCIQCDGHSFAHGQSATTSFTFANLQQGAAVSVVCYNLPAFGYCNYNSGTLTISTGATTPPGTYQVLVVCSTGSQSSSNEPARRTILCGLLGFPIGLLMLYRGRRCRVYGLGLLSVIFLTIAIGCGGNNSALPSPVVRNGSGLYDAYFDCSIAVIQSFYKSRVLKGNA